MRYATLPLALLLLIAVAPRAEMQPKPEPKGKLLAERAYFAYYTGSRIGWQKVERTEVVQDGKTLIRESESMFLKIIRDFDGQTFLIESQSTSLQTPDGIPVSETSSSTSGSQTIIRQTVFSADAVTVKETIDGGETRSSSVDAKGKKVATSNWAWHTLKTQDRLKKGETIEYDKFESDKKAFQKETWTVSGQVARKTTAGKLLEGIEVIVVGGGSVSRIVLDPEGFPLVASLQGGFSIELTDTIPKDFTPEPVSIQSAMPTKTVIKQQMKLKTMDVVIDYKHDDTDGIEPLVDDSEYHDVVKFDDENGSGYGLRLKSQKLPADFTAPKLPMADLPDDVKRYLKPTTICQSDDADLMKEARRLTEGMTDSRKAAEAVMNWVYKYLTKSSGDTGNASARQAYEEKKGDCTEHAVLFVAVARAAGLPARNIGGIVYLASGNNAFFGYHAWAEVWLGRWVPVDATVNELGTSARYIMFQIDEPGDTYGTGRISRCIGQKIKPEVNAYLLQDGTSWKRRGAREFKFGQKPQDAPTNPGKED